MFGIMACSGCRKMRMISLSDDVTTCPYCGNRSVTKNAVILFRDDDQSLVRSAMNDMTGFNAPVKEKIDLDPVSTLAYKVEHTADVQARMTLMAESLTRIKGTFTLEDIEELVPGKGERYLEMMLATCTVYEAGYGRYRI